MAETTTAEKITVPCPCGAKLKAPATAVGRKAKCPKCGEVLTVQAAAGAPRAVASQSAASAAPALRPASKPQAKVQAKPQSVPKPPPVDLDDPFDDALNDLAGWLDGPAAPAESVDARSADHGPDSVGRSAGWEI